MTDMIAAEPAIVAADPRGGRGARGAQAAALADAVRDALAAAGRSS